MSISWFIPLCRYDSRPLHPFPSLQVQAQEPNLVSNTVGFCAPTTPWSSEGPTDTTFLLIGGARPNRERIMSTPFLTSSELGQVAKKLKWNSTVKSRMALRYLAVITSVQFDGRKYPFTLETGAANMDTGGGAIIGVPAIVASAYFKAVSARATALNMSAEQSGGSFCIKSTFSISSSDNVFLQPSAVALVKTAFPPITFTFRGGSGSGGAAKVLINSEDLITHSYNEPGQPYCSVIAPMTGPLTSVPTAFWPSQPFFRGRYTGFDRRRNQLLITDHISCKKAKFVEQ